ncbi:hypothetical protein TNCV_1620341 [Trichonephila clavipes]|nr:hypothetical protein TNCV_1620341 [Trichonephila clavipes]
MTEAMPTMNLQSSSTRRGMLTPVEIVSREPTGRSLTFRGSATAPPMNYAISKADEFSKESRACPQSSNLTTLIDANAVASLRLINNNFKYSIPALNNNCTIASIITTFGKRHVKGMKISTDGQ